MLHHHLLLLVPYFTTHSAPFTRIRELIFFNFLLPWTKNKLCFGARNLNRRTTICEPHLAIQRTFNAPPPFTLLPHSVNPVINKNRKDWVDSGGEGPNTFFNDHFQFESLYWIFHSAQKKNPKNHTPWWTKPQKGSSYRKLKYLFFRHLPNVLIWNLGSRFKIENP